ncbi:MAG: PD40 domain-containing protein [Candidatus Schekmanbacteria bacterium]|nr:PD40 domain-containing protein [Candidatus Schekmanbacteria bacterium]
MIASSQYPRGPRRSALAVAVFLALSTLGPVLTRLSSAAAQGADPDIETGISLTAPKLRIGVGPFLLHREQAAPSTGGPVSAVELRDLLADDLAFFGYFDVIDIGATYPVESGRITRVSVDIPPPLPPSVGTVDARVTADLSIVDGGTGASLTGYLFEGSKDQVILGKRYRSEPDLARRMVHLLADEIALTLSGERGVAHTQIAYISDANKTKEIYVMDFDGIGNQRLTTHRSVVLSPSYSPKGDRIAFVSYADGYPGIFQFELQQGRSKPVVSGPFLHAAPAYSPDGSQIAFAKSTDDDDSEIFIAGADGSNPRRLTHQRGIDVSPVFSPTGRELAFVSARSGSPQIWIIDVEGLNPRRLTFSGGYNASPAWSPKGDLIAFSALVDDVFQIRTIRPNGEELRQLTNGLGNKEDPDFSPDGRHLCFASSELGAYRIAVMLLDGSGKRLVSQGSGNHTSPTWSP